MVERRIKKRKIRYPAEYYNYKNYRRITAIILAVALSLAITKCSVGKTEKPVPIDNPLQTSIVAEPPTVETKIKKLKVAMTSTSNKKATPVSAPAPTVSNKEIELIALVTMAEAEGESERGKRLVIDTILNRVDSDRFPDTITKVIYQPNQFTSMWNGRVNRCYVREDICQLVREELKSRTNSEVVFFTAGRYGKYGTPLFRVGNHYFCKY